MKKLTALLAAAMFSLAAAAPASAAPANTAPAANNMEIVPAAPPAANDKLAMVPATKAVKSGQKHKKIKKAKHKRAKAKARAHKRAHRR